MANLYGCEVRRKPPFGAWTPERWSGNMLPFHIPGDLIAYRSVRAASSLSTGPRKVRRAAPIACTFHCWIYEPAPVCSAASRRCGGSACSSRTMKQKFYSPTWTTVITRGTVGPFPKNGGVSNHPLRLAPLRSRAGTTYSRVSPRTPSVEDPPRMGRKARY